MLERRTKEETKNRILDIVAKEKPETNQQLKRLMFEQEGLNPKTTLQLLMALENEGKLHFIPPQKATPANLKDYLTKQKASWYWAIVALSIATTASVFTIPETAYPTAYIRNILGIIFVLFLPGYAFIKALFPATVPIKTGSENLDNIERVALSIGMSLALVPIVGLILNYTPWGIRLTPITLSLLSLTIVTATAAILREHDAKVNQPK